jgi:tetratricopeptide (TPR) repeat protein
LRTPAQHDPTVKRAKGRRNLQLAALQLQESGETSDLLVVVGEAYSALGDQSKATEVFRRAIALCSEPSSAMREAYYGLLTSLDTVPDHREEQVGTCLAALQNFPTDAQLLCVMGGYMQTQNRLEMAARAYESAYRVGQVDPWTWHVTGIDEIAASCLSLIYQLQSRDDEARQFLETALVQLPHVARLRRQLIDLHIKHDRRQHAFAELDQLPDLGSHREVLRSAVRGACLAAKQNWPAALGYLRTAYAAGCRDLLCLRWLSVTLISLGDLRSARPVVTAWVFAEPGSPEALQYQALCDSDGDAELIDLSEEDSGPQHLRLDRTANAGALKKPNFSQPTQPATTVPRRA